MNKRVIILLACLILAAGRGACAMGLSTTFGRVKVDNIEIGRAYSMEKDAGEPFVIKNTSEFELKLKIDVLIPKEKELIEGYEAIPDAGWIKPGERAFTLPAKGEASTDIVIDIPDEDIYKGKKYQAYLWSHTVGSAIAVGLRSKILISIADN